MSLRQETEISDRSSCSANELNSKSDETVPKHKQPDPVDFLIVTRIPQKNYKFQWIIQQFSTLSKNIALYSTYIHPLATPCFRLKLIKYEHGFGLFHVRKEQSYETSTAKHQTQAFSYGVKPTVVREVQKDPNNFIPKFEYKVSASDNKGKELMKWSVCFSEDSESASCKIGEYMNNSLEIFPDDLLILNCNLKVILIPTTEEVSITSEPSLKSNSWKNLSKDLKALYHNSSDTDVTLIVGTDKICAHKLILTARSAVFKKTFHHNMEEVEQNSVTITDVQFPTLQRLVEFLYTGVILDGETKDMNLQELYDLYYAADKYEVMDLREMVGNTLMGKIQVDNASEILVWADCHADKDLKSRIMNFIRINFECVPNTDAWDSCSLHHPRLAVEVANFCIKKPQMQ